MSDRAVDSQNRPVHKSPAYAAVDLGTNNCRLLIARATTTGFHVIDGYSRIVRLGEGVAASNQLNAEAMGRTLNALRVCAQKIDHWSAKRIRCIATEACRRADNGDEFLERVTAETGLPFEIVTPNLEAQLTLHGCQPLFDTGVPKTLLFDIGGGSTEIVWADQSAGSHAVAQDVLSFPMGVVTLAETYDNQQTEAIQFEMICSKVLGILEDFDLRNGVSAGIQSGNVQMIGTSGTVTTLAAMTLGLERYDRAKVDGLELNFQTINELIDDILKMNITARRNIPSIGPERADLMIMGCAILKAICTKWPVGKLRAADRGIRDGLLLEMIDRDRRNSTTNEPSMIHPPINASLATTLEDNGNI